MTSYLRHQNYFVTMYSLLIQIIFTKGINKNTDATGQEGFSKIIYYDYYAKDRILSVFQEISIMESLRTVFYLNFQNNIIVMNGDN